MFEDLVDNVFFVASGRWNMFRCRECSSGYLDPRPSASSIGKAYGEYYTHTNTKAAAAPIAKSRLHLLKKKLRNGYTNIRFGTNHQPSTKIGYWVFQLLKRKKQLVDVDYFHLPKPAPGQRLLDVGCGNGNAMAVAKSIGWQAVGVDPDPKAIEAAKAKNFNVSLGDIRNFDGQSKAFDAIILSHVIEHVPDPSPTLNRAFDLLVPGGTIFVDTPNISSRGARKFGKNWRGIEAPRHLVLFNSKSLVRLMKEIGFTEISLKGRPRLARGMYLESHRISCKYSPYNEELKLPFHLKLQTIIFTPKRSRQEFITLTAKRPE